MTNKVTHSNTCARKVCVHSCCQFHQRFMRPFLYKGYVLAAFLVTFWLWHQKFVRKKRAKMLMKLTPSVLLICFLHQFRFFYFVFISIFSNDFLAFAMNFHLETFCIISETKEWLLLTTIYEFFLPWNNTYFV